MEEAANSKVPNEECAWPKGIQEGFKEGEGAEQERRPEGREREGRSEKASGWGKDWGAASRELGAMGRFGAQERWALTSVCKGMLPQWEWGWGTENPLI